MPDQAVGEVVDTRGLQLGDVVVRPRRVVAKAESDRPVERLQSCHASSLRCRWLRRHGDRGTTRERRGQGLVRGGVDWTRAKKLVSVGPTTSASNWLSKRAAARAADQESSSSFSSSRVSTRAPCSGSDRSQKRPDPSSPTTSGMPPTAEVTAGSPARNASINTKGQFSITALWTYTR